MAYHPNNFDRGSWGVISRLTQLSQSKILSVMVELHIFDEFHDNPLTLIVVCYHESWNYELTEDPKICEDFCGISINTSKACCYNNATKECMKIIYGKFFEF